ncbi:hypothetical protein GE09DRAFT_363426 [Coniochaeta sp. 2T2.1]|nr:hypothetical protein GE09DRAFT_363426 [Coniochaeta sp. 2T2.1]
MNVLRRVMSIIRADDQDHQVTETATGSATNARDNGRRTARILPLGTDIWYLLIPYLHRRDLYNLCLVSKSLHPLAISRLYHTIQIGREPESANWRANLLELHEREESGEEWHYMTWKLSRALLSRLQNDPAGQQARAVRVLEISSIQQFEHDDEEEEWEERVDQEDEDMDEDGMLSDSGLEKIFIALIETLPCLELVRMHPQKPNYDNLTRAVAGHSNNPRLQLLGEDGSRVIDGPMPNVTALHARVNPWHPQGDGPNSHMLQLQKLFFACPNLKDFSLGVWGNYGGCRRPRVEHDMVFSFELTGEETFPPLESLSFDGYNMEKDELAHWQDRLNWSKITSLKVGPQHSPFSSVALFRRLVRSGVHANSLRSLTVTCWATDGNDSCASLERLLVSFTGLERLTVKGHFIADKHAVFNHPGLKKLCLHAIERDRRGAPRPVLDAADLVGLDAACPDLEDLEIDICRDSTGWPKDVIDVLTSRFANLRRLTLHSEVGLKWDWRRGELPLLLPALDDAAAKAFAASFFSRRGPSKLDPLAIKTGEDLRRYPKWSPPYERHERQATRTVRIRAPRENGGELEMEEETLRWPYNAGGV